MTDPRESCPDVILTAPDGARYLARCPQLLVQASRNGMPRVVVDCELMPALNVVDGRAVTAPVSVARDGFAIDLTDMPPDLAAGVAVWLAAQAEPFGGKLLAKLYPAPAPEPEPEVQP